MSVLRKSSEGFLYYEDFSDPNSLMWTLSPSYMSNVLEFGAKGPVVTEKGLVIKHSTRYVTYIMPEPVDIDEYGVIFDLSHMPVSYEDIGGVLVFNSTNQYIECQTYLATGPSEMINSDHFIGDVKELVENITTETLDKLGISVPEEEPQEESEEEIEDEEEQEETPFVDVVYKYIKVYRIKHRYYFYASYDMYHWIEVGNAILESSTGIGLFLYGTEDQYTLENARFKCNSLTFYKSRFITFSGIDTFKDFEITSDGVSILRSDSSDHLYAISRNNRTIVINTTMMPMPMKNARIRIYKKNNYDVVYNEYDLGDLYGGDEFEYSLDLRCYINDYGIRVDTGVVYDMGIFYHGSSYVKLIIHNHDSVMAKNVKVSVLKNSIYYRGDEEVFIAEYEDSKPLSELNYYKELTIDKIESSESVTLYMRLFENPTQNIFMKANDFRFKIVIE